MEEHVNVWMNLCDSSSNTILRLYYDDPQRYSFTFQITAFMSRLKLLKKTLEETSNAKLIITERSLQSDYEIFVKMMKKYNYMNDIEYEIYNYIYKDFVYKKLHGIIYVNTEFNTCLNRIQMRNRNGESIDVSYLESCEIFHKQWIDSLKIPVLKIDTGYKGTKMKLYSFLQHILVFL